MPYHHKNQFDERKICALRWRDEIRWDRYITREKKRYRSSYIYLYENKWNPTNFIAAFGVCAAFNLQYVSLTNNDFRWLFRCWCIVDLFYFLQALFQQFFSLFLCFVYVAVFSLVLCFVISSREKIAKYLLPSTQMYINIFDVPLSNSIFPMFSLFIWLVSSGICRQFSFFLLWLAFRQCCSGDCWCWWVLLLIQHKNYHFENQLLAPIHNILGFY